MPIVSKKQKKVQQTKGKIYRKYANTHGKNTKKMEEKKREQPGLDRKKKKTMENKYLY